jgi:hypothetical protein
MRGFAVVERSNSEPRAPGLQKRKMNHLAATNDKPLSRILLKVLLRFVASTKRASYWRVLRAD